MNNNNNNNNNNLQHNLPAYAKKNRVNDEMINNLNFNNVLNNNKNMNNIIIPKDENLADLIMEDNFLNNQTDEFLSGKDNQAGRIF